MVRSVRKEPRYGTVPWHSARLTSLFVRRAACSSCGRRAGDDFSYKAAPVQLPTHGRVAQWITRLPTEQKIVGSIPTVVVTFCRREFSRLFIDGIFNVEKTFVDEGVPSNSDARENEMDFNGFINFIQAIDSREVR